MDYKGVEGGLQISVVIFMQVMGEKGDMVFMDGYWLNLFFMCDLVIEDFFDVVCVLLNFGKYKINILLQDFVVESFFVIGWLDVIVLDYWKQVGIFDVFIVEVVYVFDFKGILFVFLKSGYDILLWIFNFYLQDFVNLFYYVEIYNMVGLVDIFFIFVQKIVNMEFNKFLLEYDRNIVLCNGIIIFVFWKIDILCLFLGFFKFEFVVYDKLNNCYGDICNYYFDCDNVEQELNMDVVMFDLCF